MSIVFYCNWANRQEWIYALKRKFDKEKIYIWPKIKNKDKIEYAILWNMPNNELNKFNNLKIIFSMGAGIDHLFDGYSIPKIPIIRIKDPIMRERMFNYVQSQILNYQLKIFKYLDNKKKSYWSEEFDVLDNNELNIGILGMGYLGTFIAKKLNKNDYKVCAFRQTKKRNKFNFPVYNSKRGLDIFLKKSDVIINLLPNTFKTQDFIDKNFLSKMKKKSLLINVGRGTTINENDLIRHIKKNKNFKAVLDVLKQEPPGKKHSFWKEKNIFITPHISCITNIKSAVEQIYKNYRIYKKNNKILNKINYKKQY